MKATGEVMAIDRTFGSALNKALRGLEQAGVGPLAEDPGWRTAFDYLAGVYAGDPDADEPIRWVDEAGQACESTRHAQRTAAPIVLRRFLEPSDSRLWRILGLLRRGIPRGRHRRGDRHRPVVPVRDGPERRPRGRGRGDRREPRRPGRRRRRRAAGDGQAGGVRRPRAGRPGGHDRRRDPGRPAGPRPAPGLRDGRHVRRRVRGRDAVLLLDLRGGGLGPRGAAGRASRGARHRLGSGPDRAGDRVRLLRGPGRRHAPPRRLERGHDQLEPGDGLDRLRRVDPALLRAARPGERAQRHRRRDARRRRAAARGRRLRRPDAAQPRRAAGGRGRAAARRRASRRSTRPRSGRASRPCSTGSASRSPRAAWPTRSRRR